jgi:hypothetical protein
VAETALSHLIYTKDATGNRRLYRDGVEVAAGAIGGSLDNWGDYRFALANEPPGGRPWLGSFFLVAVYDRALSVAEVVQNFEASLGIVTTSELPTQRAAARSDKEAPSVSGEGAAGCSISGRRASPLVLLALGAFVLLLFRRRRRAA